MLFVSLAADRPVAPIPAPPHTDVRAFDNTSDVVSAVMVISPHLVATDALSSNKIRDVALAVTAVLETGTPTNAPVLISALSLAITEFVATISASPLFEPVP